MKEINDSELKNIEGGGDWIDYAAAFVGLAVGSLLTTATFGMGSFGAGATGLMAAAGTEAILRDVTTSPTYTPGLDDRYGPILTQ